MELVMSIFYAVENAQFPHINYIEVFTLHSQKKM